MAINECPSCGRYPHLANCPHARGMSVASWPLASIHPTTPEGVWALCDRDYNETITAVYATEVEALRAINGRGYGDSMGRRSPAPTYRYHTIHDQGGAND